MQNQTTDQYYKSRYVFDKRRSLVWKEIVKFLSRYIPADSTVIDLGAGYCDFVNNVKAAKKYAVDTSPELANFASPETIKINAAAWDLKEIPSASVDVVHASNLFEHFSDEELEKVMKEVKRVLKPGGKLVLMQPNYRLASKNYFDDPTHKKVFSDAALESFLVSHDLKIVLKKARFLPFSMRSNSSIIPEFLLPFIVRAYILSPLKPFAGQMLFVSQKQQ